MFEVGTVGQTVSDKHKLLLRASSDGLVEISDCKKWTQEAVSNRTDHRQ